MDKRTYSRRLRELTELEARCKRLVNPSEVLLRQISVAKSVLAEKYLNASVKGVDDVPF